MASLLHGLIEGMVILWFVASVTRMQQALRWWSQRQSDRLLDESDRIRNGLLQDIFTLRRNLELNAVHPYELSSDQQQQWLRQFEALHSSLDRLSNVLCPPFVEDDFSLALQTAIADWKTQQPEVVFILSLMKPDSSATPTGDRTLLVILHELLTLICTEMAPPTQIQLDLSTDSGTNQLTLQASYCDRPSAQTVLTHSDLTYLKLTFQMLTGGGWWLTPQLTANSTILCWRLRWPLVTPPTNP